MSGGSNISAYHLLLDVLEHPSNSIFSYNGQAPTFRVVHLSFRAPFSRALPGGQADAFVKSKLTWANYE